MLVLYSVIPVGGGRGPPVALQSFCGGQGLSGQRQRMAPLLRFYGRSQCVGLRERGMGFEYCPTGRLLGGDIGRPSMWLARTRGRQMGHAEGSNGQSNDSKELESERQGSFTGEENGEKEEEESLPVETTTAPQKRGRPTRKEKNERGSFLSRFGGPGNTTLRFFFSLIVLNLLLNLWPLQKSPVPGYLPPSRYVTVKLPFSDFLESLKKEEIRFLAVEGNRLRMRLKDQAGIYASFSKDMDKSAVWFETVKPKDYRLPYDSLMTKGTRFTVIEKSIIGDIANALLYLVGFVALLSVMNKAGVRMPHRGGGFVKRGTSGGNAFVDVTFDDVAGVDEAKEELEEIVEYLKEPGRFLKLGARPPRGVLLSGPPGTGKTLLAKAVAGEAGVPFYSTSASEFVELYVGMGALRVRELFTQARKNAPAIVFIDEIDAVAKGRDTPMKGFRSSGNDEREQTLNQLLTELDGFNSEGSGIVICIAATNRPDVLDPALLRPGRFDRRVPVERPDKIGREQILRVHIDNNNLPLDASFDISSLASQTIGFTGADLANVVNEAALLAGRSGKDVVGFEDFDSAILRTVAGIEKKRSILQGEERSVVARHEVGHALVGMAVSMLAPTVPKPERLSIIPRSGGALGFTYSPPTAEDRALAFESEIRGQLATLMGGRAAEVITSSSISTGASDDLRRATELAQRCVTEFGLNQAIGPINVGALAMGSEYVMAESGEMSSIVEQEVRSLCTKALEAAQDVITCNRDLHTSLSTLLEQDERLQGESLQESLKAVHVPQSLRDFVTS
ncbi:hypothetical protein M9435_000604 [Picochlorum sp. BPE23]|nr:hypothetical protein M9435_000604 [Picochlorum sp. BPE23]